jgi:DNA polymerase III subunit chi
LSDAPPSRPEALFYHLELKPLDEVLPMLVEKTLERGWRAVIQAGSAERVEALDTLLWTYRDDSFLPHGVASTGQASDHPVVLTTADDNPNGATVRFCVDGCDITSFDGYARVVILFDGRDEAAVQRARGTWKRAIAAGTAATYWQQSADGRWERKA